MIQFELDRRETKNVTFSSSVSNVAYFAITTLLQVSYLPNFAITTTCIKFVSYISGRLYMIIDNLNVKVFYLKDSTEM